MTQSPGNGTPNLGSTGWLASLGTMASDLGDLEG